MEFINQIPKDLINFLIVTLFSLLIGLEQRKHHIGEQPETLFGTDRTLSLIGILGFILYTIAPVSLIPFLVGGIVLSVFLSIFYNNKIKMQGRFGLTSVIIALITYSLTPLVYLQPPWLVMLTVVTVLIFVEVKENLFNISKKIGPGEFTTFAKFIIVAGIILPLLSHTPFSEQINISPYQFWLTIVAVSTISYFSYLLRKFVFPNSGLMLTAILGGLYSSTATTIILAKKNKSEKSNQTPAGIIASTGVMYLRILILAWLFNKNVAISLFPYFISLIIVSAVISLILLRNGKSEKKQTSFEDEKNPLEFKTALVFGFLFAFFAIITNIVLNKYGNLGIGILSFIVGVTDIDPYILNLFQSNISKITIETVVMATLLATASNNFIKMIYSIVLGDKSMKGRIIIGFSIIIAASLIIAGTKLIF